MKLRDTVQANSPFSRVTLLALLTMVALSLSPRLAFAQACPSNDPSLSCKKVEVPCEKVPGYRLSGCNGGVVTSIPLLGGLAIFHNSFGALQATEGIGKGWSLMGAVVDSGATPLLRAASGDVTNFVEPSGRRGGAVFYESVDKMRGDLRRLLPIKTGGWQLLEPSGASTFYTYSVQGKWLPTSFMDPKGVTSNYTYGAPGAMIPTSITVPGAPTIYLNVSNGVLRTVTYRGMAMWLMYNALGQLNEIRNPDGTSQRIVYNSKGHIASLINPFRRQQRYHYELQSDDRAILSSVRDYNGKLYRFSYRKDQTKVRAPGSIQRITWAESGASAPVNMYPKKTERFRLKTKQPIHGGPPIRLNPTNAQYQTVRTLEVDGIGRPIAITDEANSTTRIYYGLKADCSDVAAVGSSPFPTCVVAGDGSAIRTERDSRRNFLPTKISRFSPSAQVLATNTIAWNPHPSKSPLISPLLGGTSTTSNFTRGGRATPVLTRTMRASYKPGSVVPFQVDTSETSSYEWDASKALLTQALYPNGSSQAWAYAANGDLTSVTQNGLTTKVESAIEKDGTRSATLANATGSSKSTRNGTGTRTTQLISILVKNPSRGSYNYTPIEGDASAGGESMTAAGAETLPYESSGATDVNEDGSSTWVNSCNSLDGSCIETCKCKPDGSVCDQSCMQECSMADDGEGDDGSLPPDVGDLDIYIEGDGYGEVHDAAGKVVCFKRKEGSSPQPCKISGVPLYWFYELTARPLEGSTFFVWDKPAECREWTVATHEPKNPCPVFMNLNPQIARAKFEACRKAGETISGNQQCCAGVERCGKTCGCSSGKTCNKSNNDPSKWSCVTTQCATSKCDSTCTCPSGLSCSGGRCTSSGSCTPQCAGKSCGSDGCGGTCGTCKSAESCVNGQCTPPPPATATPAPTSTPVPQPTSTPVVQPTATPVPPPPCVPNCAGKNCGEDGCGGSCGTCTQGQLCNASGQCTGASCRTARMVCVAGQTTAPCCPGLSCRNGLCSR